MNKKKIILEDGRYLIYYSFRDKNCQNRPTASKSPKEASAKKRLRGKS